MVKHFIMATEHFCLRWNNHQSTLISVFDNLLESGTLVDCTLAADGRYLKAHKVVLSACSPYLGMLLSQHYDKHPIIILKDVKYDELKAMLDYMYRGEVNISQEQLSTFLKAAETLQIKGLTDTGGDEGNGVQPNRPPSSNSTTSLPNEDPQSPAPPGEGRSSPAPKRKRNKHSDESLDIESQVKVVSSDGSDRSIRDSVSISGIPSNSNPLSALKNVSFGSVKREPSETDGDGQMSVDESGDSTMLSRPGPSNGSGSNNKGSPWVLSADSTGEEMQLTPGQDGVEEIREVSQIKNGITKPEPVLKQSLNSNAKNALAPAIINSELSGVVTKDEQETIMNNVMIYNDNDSEEELIIPDVLDNSKYASKKLQEKDYNNRIHIIHAQQLELDHSSQDPLSDEPHQSSKDPFSGSYLSSDQKVMEKRKLIKENVSNKNSQYIATNIHSTSEASSKQCTILKGLNEHELAAKNFRNVSISKTDEESSMSSKKAQMSCISEPNSTAGSVNRNRVCTILSKSTQNVASKFRKILPIQNPPNILPQTEKSESQIPTFNHTNTSTTPQVCQSMPSVPYTFSFASPLQTATSSSQQIQNSLSLQIQPQFTISTSQSSSLVPQLTSSATTQQINTGQVNLSIQPQFTFSPPQFQAGNVQAFVPQRFPASSAQPISTQNIVVNRPPLFVSPKAIGTEDASKQSDSHLTKSENNEISSAYVKTDRGFMKLRDICRIPGRGRPRGRSRGSRGISRGRGRGRGEIFVKPKIILPKILPKPGLTPSEHMQTICTIRENTEFIISSINNNANI